MKKTKSTQPDNARNSVTESPDYTEGRARSERRIASGNRRSGAAAAIKALPEAGKKKTPSSRQTKKAKKT